MRIGFLGTGAIAAAMVRGLAGQGHKIVVSERGATTAAQLVEDIAEVEIATNADVVANTDVVVVCLLAHVAKTVLPDLPFRDDQTVISVMADAPLADLAVLCAPAHDIAIALPLPAIAGGGTHLPCYPANDRLNAMFGATNTVSPVPSEMALNAHFAATALCSPMLAQLIAVSNWLTTYTGSSAAAEGFVHSIATGCLRDGEDGLEAALAKLATEGGLNATLRAHMQGAESDMQNGLDAFRARLGLMP